MSRWCLSGCWETIWSCCKQWHINISSRPQESTSLHPPALSLHSVYVRGGKQEQGHYFTKPYASLFQHIRADWGFQYNFSLVALNVSSSVKFPEPRSSLSWYTDCKNVKDWNVILMFPLSFPSGAKVIFHQVQAIRKVSLFIWMITRFYISASWRVLRLLELLCTGTTWWLLLERQDFIKKNNNNLIEPMK